MSMVTDNIRITLDCRVADQRKRCTRSMYSTTACLSLLISEAGDAIEAILEDGPYDIDGDALSEVSKALANTERDIAEWREGVAALAAEKSARAVVEKILKEAGQS